MNLIKKKNLCVLIAVLMNRGRFQLMAKAEINLQLRMYNVELRKQKHQT